MTNIAARKRQQIRRISPDVTWSLLPAEMLCWLLRSLHPCCGLQEQVGQLSSEAGQGTLIGKTWWSELRRALTRGGEAVTENIISKLNVPFLILDSCSFTQCSLVLCLDKAEQTPGRNFHINDGNYQLISTRITKLQLCGKQRILKSAGECFTKNTLCIRFPKFRNGIKTQIIHWGSER